MEVAAEGALQAPLVGIEMVDLASKLWHLGGILIVMHVGMFFPLCFARSRAVRGVCLCHLTEVPQIVKEASEAYRHLEEVTKGIYIKVLDDHSESRCTRILV